MTYVPRRLRKPAGPRVAIVAPEGMRVTNEMAELIRSRWRASRDVFVLGPGWTVTRVR